jgi:hypothetical protein
VNRYGDLTPITAWGRALACFAAIYGISTVSMLVSVLVGRYQRVYSRKRYLNEDLSDRMLFNETSALSTSNDPCLENLIEQDKCCESALNTDYARDNRDDLSTIAKSDLSSSKVRFIIGYVSDDDNDDTDYDQDYHDNNDTALIKKIAHELLQSRTK